MVVLGEQEEGKRVCEEELFLCLLQSRSICFQQEQK